ncbi:hypothetical protein AMJ86_06120, partial [bacterium SM23_57]
TNESAQTIAVKKKDNSEANLTPWILFTVFVLGPCEPLIPLLMYPAAKGNITNVVVVASIFSAATILTMTATVLVLRAGVSFLPLKHMERYIHALAGGTILLCGVSIRFLGL